MQISMYEASVPMFVHALRALRAILEKAVAHAEQKKFDSAVLANSRLFPDMLPLISQIQIASDAAKGAAARLAGIDPPKFEDSEKTFAELIARVALAAQLRPVQSFGTGNDQTVILEMNETPGSR